MTPRLVPSWPASALGIALAILPAILLAGPLAGRAPAAPPAAATPAASAAIAATAAGPSPLATRIDQAVERLAPQLVEVRHRIHQNPELGNRETETASLVAARLRELGLEVKTGVAKTGIVGILKGGRPGPVVAVRADMDALPVAEQTDLPFKSAKRTTYLGQEVGVAHACGHDVHTSAGLGTAAVLASVKGDLPGTVVFIFQPAEEGPPPGEKGGAALMMEERVLESPKPEAIFALHSFPEIPVGQVGYTEGPTYAAVDHFVIHVKGKQSHGAYPHLGVDPVVMAAEVITALQTIRSRNVPALEPSVVTVGIVRGGERFNILPAEVLLEGTVRTYSEEVRKLVERRMREIADGVTRAGGGSFDLTYEHTSPATVNDPALSRRVRPSLERALGAANVIDTPPVMGGEDFSFFANAVPGFYFRLGTTKAGTESGGLHTPTFRADDSAVAVGMRAMSRLVADYLAAGGRRGTGG